MSKTQKMSPTSNKREIGSKSSYKSASTKESLQSRRSQNSRSFTSEHGSKFGRSVSKYPKLNDPSLVQSVSIVNSRVIRSLISFPIKNNSKLPDLTQKEATDCIRELGRFFDIVDYEFNYTTFWLLDILSKLIKHMQLRGFSISDQNVCLAWFRFVLRCISISGETREEIFSLLQEMFLKAEEYIKTGNSVPQPEEINISETKLLSGSAASVLSSKSLPSITSSQKQRKLSRKSLKSPRNSSLVSHSSKRSRSSKSSVKSYKKSTTMEEKIAAELQILHTIIDMIYKVFADRFMFSQISQAYSSPKIVTPVDILLDFKDPKQLRPTLEVTLPESPKTKKSVSKSSKKPKDKETGKKKGSPKDEKDKTKTVDGDNKSPKKGKSKERGTSEIKSEVKKGKGKKKSSDDKEDKTESKRKAKGRGKEKIEKGKKKSKSSEQTEIGQPKEDSKETTIPSSKTKPLPKSKSVEERQDSRQIEEKLKLFDRTVAPEMKLEMKKIEVKDKFILPLAEGAPKDYVENLIQSLLPWKLETKPMDDLNFAKDKNGENKSTKSYSLNKGKKKSLKTDKKGKGKKK